MNGNYCGHDGNAAISAMFGHVLAVGEVTGTYSLNPP